MNKKDVKEEKRTGAPAISRRTFAMGVVGSVALLGLGTLKFLPGKTICRPPGGQNEEGFLAGCLHCERCREICPKTAISPAHIEDGILSARTPRMNYKQGWCDFCETVEGGPRCIAVCPTHALAEVDASQVIIGTAILNRDWCLAAKGMGCHKCVDACNYHALELGYDNVPVIDFDACNGCGACEFSCVSLSSGSITVGATDRAIIVIPTIEAEALRAQKEAEGVYQ